MASSIIKTLWCAIFFLVFIFQISLPELSFAAETGISAGFAPSSVWVSRSNVASGTSVNIFVVLYNSSEEPITGDLTFMVDNTAIGTKNFTIGVGETKIESFPWVAQTGTHSVSAKIAKVLNTNTNKTATLSNETTDSISVQITPPPPPSVTAETLNSIIYTVGSGVSSTAPVVANALKTIYNTTESVRNGIKSALDKQTGTSTGNNIAASNSETSVSKQKGLGIVNPEPANTLDFIPKAKSQAASVILSIVSSKLLFYITLIGSFLFLILLIRMFFKSRRKRL